MGHVDLEKYAVFHLEVLDQNVNQVEGMVLVKKLESVMLLQRMILVLEKIAKKALRVFLI